MLLQVEVWMGEQVAFEYKYLVLNTNYRAGEEAVAWSSDIKHRVSQANGQADQVQVPLLPPADPRANGLHRATNAAASVGRAQAQDASTMSPDASVASCPSGQPSPQSPASRGSGSLSPSLDLQQCPSPQLRSALIELGVMDRQQAAAQDMSRDVAAEIIAGV